MNVASDIIDFNQLILGIEQREKGLLAPDEFAISHKCLAEEVEEFIIAHDAGNLIGSIDAIIDNIYFAFGILYKLGLNAEEINRCIAAVHLCNMTKKRGTNAKRDTGAADAIKPADWIGPEDRIKEILCLTQS